MYHMYFHHGTNEHKYFVDSSKVAVVKKNRRATMFADFNFTTSTQADDFFQFIDCSETEPGRLAKDVRAGVVPIHYSRVVIAIGNSAPMDRFTNVATPVNLLINALVERLGCYKMKIWVIGVLPRPCQNEEQRQIMIRINKGLKKSVDHLVRRKSFPLTYLAAQRWLMKRVEHEGGVRQMLPDTSLYLHGTNDLNDVGLKHMYLLLAKELKLREIQYEWDGPPVMFQKAGRQVFLGADGRQVAKRRAEEMECRDELPRWEKKVESKIDQRRKQVKKRRSTKERGRKGSHRPRSVVVRVEGKQDGDESGRTCRCKL